MQLLLSSIVSYDFVSGLIVVHLCCTFVGIFFQNHYFVSTNI